jgi:hypothetical protein
MFRLFGWVSLLSLLFMGTVHVRNALTSENRRVTQIAMMKQLRENSESEANLPKTLLMFLPVSSAILHSSDERVFQSEVGAYQIAFHNEDVGTFSLLAKLMQSLSLAILFCFFFRLASMLQSTPLTDPKERLTIARALLFLAQLLWARAALDLIGSLFMSVSEIKTCLEVVELGAACTAPGLGQTITFILGGWLPNLSGASGALTGLLLYFLSKQIETLSVLETEIAETV